LAQGKVGIQQCSASFSLCKAWLHWRLLTFTSTMAMPGDKTFQEIFRPRKEEPDTYKVRGSMSVMLDIDSGSTSVGDLATKDNGLSFKASCSDALAKAVGVDATDVSISSVTEDPPARLKVDYCIDFGGRASASNECCNHIKTSPRFAEVFTAKLMEVAEVQGFGRPIVSGVTTAEVSVDVQHNVTVQCCTVM